MTIMLPDEEARHAAGSRRLEQGDTLTLFNGKGLVSDAKVVSLGSRGRKVELKIVSTRVVEEPVFMLHLACALPKGDRLSIVLDMVTQLGIASFTPLHCERSVVKVGDNAERRWRRIMIEACKQSRQAYIPTLRSAENPVDLSERESGPVWVAHPGGAVASTMSSPDDNLLTILVGPEGGFSDSEVEKMIANGAKSVSLGAAILRIETAAVALTSYARLRYTEA